MVASCVVMGGHVGHRYTLTEGDFHHLKNARLTHLHLPPLKIVTIHECDSGEASATAMPHPTATPKASLAIFQVSEEGLAARMRLGGQELHPHLAGGTFPAPWGRAPHLRTGRGASGGAWRVAGPSIPPHPPMLFDLSLLPPLPWLCLTAPGEGPHWPLRGPQLRPAR